MMSRKLTEDQRAPYRVLEVLTAGTAIAVIGLIVYLAKQDQKLDDMVNAFPKVVQSVAEIKGKVDMIEERSKTMARDVDRNREEIRGLRRELRRDSARN